MLKLKSGLINKDVKSLAKKSWYNQRFDACLNLCWMIAELEIRAEKRKKNWGNDRLHIGIFEDHRLDWYIDYIDIKRITSNFLSQAKKGNNIGYKLIQKWKVDELAFDKFIAKFPDKLLHYSNRNLSAIYNSLTSLYIKALSSSSLIDGFALGSDEIVQNEVNKLLKKRNILSGAGDIFSALTSPVHQSFINQAELSLLNISLKIGSLKLLNLKIKEPTIQKMLVKHQREYFWIKNNYHDRYILSVEDFVEEIKTVLASRIDIKEEIKRLKNNAVINRRKKAELFKKLKPDRYLKNLLEISEQFTYWQDERKRRTMLFTHAASLLIEEIGCRYDYTLEMMRYLTRVEVETLLKGKKIPISELSARAKKMIIYQKGNDYEIKFGQEATIMVNKIFKSTDHSDIQDFRGLTASTGKARGIAKIVTSVRDAGKVNKGDILVAVMTRPDYIMGIKKAAAIITDEGGITCHAAIISRELGIPCIIGTKIGTKILKDGDMVEVNANHGWVRKIN